MPKRKLPQTSLDAKASLQPDQIRAIYQKIVEALKVLGMASSEQIATHLTMDHSKIHKRTKEMETLEMIYRPGTRVPTKSGRTAYQWGLRNNQPITEKSIEKSFKGPSVADFSRKLIPPNPPIQTNLF